MSATRYPQTIAQAVDLLRAHLPEDALGYLKSMDSEERAVAQIDLGESVHELLGLRQPHTRLLEETGSDSVDAASTVLLRALWRNLHQTVH